MSEHYPIYDQGPARPTIYKRYDAGFEPPSGAEIKAEIARAGLTGAQAAALLGYKSSRQVRKLTSGEKNISYAMWRLLCIYSGSIVADTKVTYRPEAREPKA
ncbi:helix-turn-helix domain-containing protein [Microbulbifer sp. ZKSA006]|uniref:helix-turn-helix domain-containing protein n=1 Tax=Microbulbifer sp. ZKSA006 TaxID=3243390 RepID=UPI004039F9C6